MKEDVKKLSSKIDALNRNTEILIKLVALNVGKDSFFKHRESKEEKIEALDSLDIPDSIVALIVGSTTESVRSIRSRRKIRSKDEKNTSELEFHPEDLGKVLNNPRIFSSSLDLVDFANSILQPQPWLTPSTGQEELVQNIISTFKSSDRMKQALFIQALEHRATDKALRDTEFLKFLETWQKHIGR